MIERIRLEDDTERYTVTVGAGEVVVIMALNGPIKVFDAEEYEKAEINQYETWTASNSPNAFNPLQFIIITTQETGADFLIVRYYR